MDAICLHNLFMVLKAGARKVVLPDITFLTEKLAILAAALDCRGRAIPLCMWAFERENLLRSQNTLTHQMLAHLRCTAAGRAAAASIAKHPRPSDGPAS